MGHLECEQCRGARPGARRGRTREKRELELKSPHARGIGTLARRTFHTRSVAPLASRHNLTFRLGAGACQPVSRLPHQHSSLFPGLFAVVERREARIPRIQRERAHIKTTEPRHFQSSQILRLANNFHCVTEKFKKKLLKGVEWGGRGSHVRV